MTESSTVPDRGKLLTEQRLQASSNLDILSTRQVLELINQQDAAVPAAVQHAIPQIEQFVSEVAAAIKSGGRLVYVGAGTSGRLGVLDASECPPTFFVDPGVVVGVIAGGDKALRTSSEGKEDDPDGAKPDFQHLKLSQRDIVLGIAAGGTTPYVLGALSLAKSLGAKTGLLTCADPPANLAVDHLIRVSVGPEIVTGSTRMKAGTATKLVLNMISTSAMVALGKTWGNLMVDLRATNAKLRDRAARILQQQCGLSRDAALQLLDRAKGRVKLALVMALRNLEPGPAQTLLEEHHGFLRPILGAPR